MAVNLFDHPYAATGNKFEDSDYDKNSETDIDFKDSPRKVLVQESKVGSLNILNEIIQSHEFSCLNKSVDSVKENGFHVETEASSSDDMEVEKDSATEHKDKENREKDEEQVVKEKNKEDDDESEVNGGKSSSGEVSKDKLESPTSDIDSSKVVLDIFKGITDVFDSMETELTSNINGVEGESEKLDTEKDNKTSEKKSDVAKEIEKGDNEMVTSANETAEVDEDTDSANEDSLDQTEDNSLDNSTELTSEIKTNANNGIVISVLKRKRRGKRKNTCWTRRSPYKIKRLNSGSPRKVTIVEPVPETVEQMSEQMNDVSKDDDNIEDKNDVPSDEVGTQTALEDDSFNDSITQIKEGNSSQSDDPEGLDLSQRKRSRTPNYKPGFAFGDEIDKEIDTIDAPTDHKGYFKRKKLLFNKGRRASPSQTKPLSQNEVEKYRAPFTQGWKRELVYRGVVSESTAKTQADTYYFPPTGPKLVDRCQKATATSADTDHPAHHGTQHIHDVMAGMGLHWLQRGKKRSMRRSMVQISDWLKSHNTDLTADNFTFMRRPIGVEGEMVRNAAQSRSKPLVEQAIRRKKAMFSYDSHVHDDNDGQFDKPEVVIERDSDDFLVPIMSAATESESSPKRDIRRGPGRPRKELIEKLSTGDDKSIDVIKLPKLEELKTEKIETMQPSNEEVIISPPKTKREKEHKATARKSTTQKIFRKGISLSGIENLCSLACPGMDGIPPMLHCNVCMCLFHNECVNYFGQDSDFVCLRCKNLQPPSAGGAPITGVDGNVMKMKLPSVISHLNSSTPSIVTIVPNINQNKSKLLPTNFQQGKSVRMSTPSSSVLPLYKALAMSSNSPSPVSSVNNPFNYPVMLTKNLSAQNTSTFSSTKSPFLLYPPAVSSSSQSVLSHILPKSLNFTKPQEYEEMKTVIKQEPIDDDYLDTTKDESGKHSHKGVSFSKASSEALDSLKNVLSSRLGSPQSSTPEMKTKIPISNMNVVAPKQLHSTPSPVRFLNAINPNSSLNLAQNLNQPRMAFTLTSPSQNQFLQNQEYRIVPIGPPMPMGNLQTQLPLLQGNPLIGPGPNQLRHPVIVTPQAAQKIGTPVVTSDQITSQEDTGGAINSTPLVVNAKHVSPMNGQLLTLPPLVVKKLTLTRPLALKINNRQIVVPPSGFFPSSEGLKVFLPPNTFPTADENVIDVSVSNEKTKEDTSNAAEPNSTKDTCFETEDKTDLSLKANIKDMPDEKTDAVNETSSVTATDRSDITKNKFYKKCCFIQKLYGGYDCMFHIFKYLELKDLVRMSKVCRAWKRISMLSELWTDVSFSDTKISDWGKALRYISRRDVQSVSLKSLSHFEEPNRTWHQLVSSLHELQLLQKISFGLVPAAVLQSVAGKLKQLESFNAESISDFTDESMWTVPTKLDVGNFSCMTSLKELRLKGTGGLSLPSFSFGFGFCDLGKLKNLHTLHLTSFRNLEGLNFHFISNLTNLKDLALGDCDSWTSETYTHLGKLTSLRKLQLENGGEIPDTGLGLALSQMAELETLNLKKYTIAYTFGNHISSLHKLKHLKIFPVNMHYMGEVNTNTLHAVENLKKIKTLDWIIQKTSVNSIIIGDSDSMDADEPSDDTHHWIPFQTEASESVKSTAQQYISLQDLKDKLCKLLPEAKIQVYTAQSERILV